MAAVRKSSGCYCTKMPQGRSENSATKYGELKRKRAQQAAWCEQRKFRSHISKKYCAKRTNSLDKNRSQIKMWAKVVGCGNK